MSAAPAEGWGRLQVATPIAIFALQLCVAATFLFDRSPGTDAAWTSFPLDDSWIHLVYARSLAAFEGFAYNPGQPEAGFTSPLWTLLLAPLFWIAPLWGGDPIPAVKALGFLVAFGCSMLAMGLVSRISGRPAAGAAAAALIACEPTFMFAALSGMEVALAATTVLFTLWLLARGRIVTAAASLALAPLARPENTLFVLLAAPMLVGCLRDRNAPARAWIAAAAPCAIAGAMWIGWCLWVTGHPLPSTFYVKSLDSAALPLLRGVAWNLASIAETLRALPAAGFGLGALLVLLGAWHAWRFSGRTPFPALSAAARLAVLHPPVFLIGVAFTHTLADPNYFYWSRYVQPAIPPLLVLFALGVAAFFIPPRPDTPSDAGAERGEGAAGRRSRRVWHRAGLVLILLCATAVLLQLPRRTLERAKTFAWNSQNMAEVQVAIGRWLREHSAPEDVVATIDAGAVRFYSDRTTLDLVGLNHHALLSDRSEALRRMRPRYVVTFPGESAGAFRSRGELVQRFAASSETYTVSPASIQAQLVIYEVTELPKGGD